MLECVVDLPSNLAHLHLPSHPIRHHIVVTSSPATLEQLSSPSFILKTRKQTNAVPKRASAPLFVCVRG